MGQMKRFTYAVALLAVVLSLNSLRAADAIMEEVDEGGAGKVLPKITSQPPPIFPASLVRSGAGGKVIVAFTVSEEGSVRDAVVTSSPQRLLNPYAIKAVGAWRFEPGTRDGQPAAFRLRASVDFSANDETSPDKSDFSNALPSVKNKPYDVAPVARRQPLPVYPYEMVLSGQSGTADASFVVDYAGHPLFTVAAGSSDRAFGKAVIAMVEASEYSPGRKGARRVMSPTSEHFQFDGEASLNPDARRVLGELRKPSPAILSITQLDERPKVIEQVSPAYPRALKDDGLTGQAEIEFIVSRDGLVLFPRVVSATHEDFGWAAAVAVAQWRYQPPQKDGRNVDVRMTVPVLFTAQKLAESD
jgi:TonB family protein